MKHNNVRHSLERQIFLSLVGISFSSVILIALFWANSKAGDYYQEVKQLKNSYSDKRKADIKIKILQIKDYIEWIQNNPLQPVSLILAKETNHLKLPLGPTNRAFKDSVEKSRVPVFVLNEEGKIIYSFNPFSKGLAEMLDAEKKQLLEKIRLCTDDKGIVTIFNSEADSEPKLEAIGYYNFSKLSGYKILSLVSADEIINVIKLHALDSISNMRYSKNEYVFINTMAGKALISNGTYNNPAINILTSGDSAWIEIFKHQQNAYFMPDGYFYTCIWPKMETAERAPKTSYFSHVSDWQWIIGTGFYEDEINAVIESKERDLINDLRQSIYKVLLYLLFSLLVSYILARLFHKRLERNIALFRGFFDKAATENYSIDKSRIYYKEFDFMADSANHMVDKREQAEAEIIKLNLELEKRVSIRTAQLEEANKDLESFSYSISHDLRAPLRAINGFSHILATRHKESLNEEGQKYMEYVFDASCRMEKLINDLLNYSRIGRKTPDLIHVDLNELFDSIHIVFKHELEETGGSFIQKKGLPGIISDQILLYLTITNIVSNAIKYRRKEIPLIIEAGYKNEDHHHIILITDNGIGIAEEFWLKIFDVFQRLHTEETYSGTGIGLASAKKAISILGGTIRVESIINKGSTFYITLPE